MLRGIYDLGGVRKQNGHYQSSNLIQIEPHEIEIMSVPYTCVAAQNQLMYNACTCSVIDDGQTEPYKASVFRASNPQRYYTVSLTPGKYRFTLKGHGMADTNTPGGGAEVSWGPRVCWTIKDESRTSLSLKSNDNPYFELNNIVIVDSYLPYFANGGTIWDCAQYPNKQIGTIDSLTGDPYTFISSTADVTAGAHIDRDFSFSINFTITEYTEWDIEVYGFGGFNMYASSGAEVGGILDTLAQCGLCFGLSLHKVS